MKKIIIGLLVLTMASPSAYAVDPGDVPSSATVEVIQAKIEGEAKSKLAEATKGHEVEVIEELPPLETQRDIPFFVQDIELTGEQVLAPEDLDKLVEPYEGREITFTELKELMRNIELTYRGEGFFGIIFLPPQRITDKKVELRAIISKMGTLSVEGAKHFRESRIRSYWKIKKGDILKYDELLNSLHELNQNPDRLIRPLLKAGKEPKTTDVILKVEETFPIHLGYTFDNQGANLTGEKRNGFTMKHTNLLTLDDIFLIGTTYGRSFGALFLTHLIPITNFGTRVSYSFSHSQVNPKKEFERFGINGVSQSYSIDLKQRLYRSGRLMIDSNIGFNFNEKRTKIFAITTSWDRLRVLNAGLQFQLKDRSGVWAWGNNFSFGFPLHGDGFPLNSRGAETQFFKYDFSFTRLQRLPQGMLLNITSTGQLSDNRLMPQQQKFVGGAASVRGYPESDFGGDQGILTRAELSIPSYIFPEDWTLPYTELSLRQQIKFLTFLDHAHIRINDPAATDRHTRNLMGVGGGIQMQLTKYLNARIELAWPIGDKPLTESGTKQIHFRIGADI